MIGARFTFIDGLRGIAALAVVLFHAEAGSHIDLLPSGLRASFTFGELGVAVFFVISGFVITHSLIDRNLTASEIVSFMIGRSIRLDPPYWTAIIVTIALGHVASVFVSGHTPTSYSAEQLIAHFFYLQELLGYPEIGSVFWTLCYEIQFYLVFSILLSFRSNSLLAGVFLLSLLWPFHLAPEIRGLFVNLFYQFLLGAGAYYAWRYPKARIWFALYAVTIFGVSLLNENRFGVTCAATAAVVAIVALRGRLSDLLNFRTLQRLGLISYSLYLIHNPISGAAFRVWYMMMGRSPASQACGLVFVVGTCIGAAFLMYYVVERPCIALSKSWRSRLRHATTAS